MAKDSAERQAEYRRRQAKYVVGRELEFEGDENQLAYRMGWRDADAGKERSSWLLNNPNADLASAYFCGYHDRTAEDVRKQQLDLFRDSQTKEKAE